jgi:hypothetical protein
MRRVRNLTLHEQGEAELRMAARAGVCLSAEARGVVADGGQGGFRVAAKQLAAELAACLRAGEGALVGGHTGVWLAASWQCREQEGRLPSLWYWETARRRDEAGRFVFVPERLAELEWER